MAEDINKVQEAIDKALQIQSEAIRKVEIEIFERMKDMDKMVKDGSIDKSNPSMFKNK